MASAFLSRFTPSLMAPETLEAIFVQRERLASRTVALIRESVLGPEKHHTLIIGPRGIGKTHFISLVHHRVQAMEDLRDRVRIAWLREEEWGVSSFLDLLIRILRALGETYPDSRLEQEVSRLFELDAASAEREAAHALERFLGGRTLFLILENVDDLFDGLGEQGQQKFRAYLQNHASWTILAAAQGLFSGVSLQSSPFYGFFRIKHLKELSLDEAAGLLRKIAVLTGDHDLAAYIGTPAGRARIRAVHHLAGGNHRIYVILSQFLTRKSLDELVEPFLSAMDDLTPYYQARMAWLSPQQRKIVDVLCVEGRALPVKELARRCFLSSQVTSSQLKTLRQLGYVQQTPVGRETYYELREPLMRLSFEVKRQRGGPIRLFVDFLRFWYSRYEMEQSLAALDAMAGLERQYFESALAMIDTQAEDPRVAACLSDLRNLNARGEWGRCLEISEEMIAIRGEARDYRNYAVYLMRLDRIAEAEGAIDQAISLGDGNDPDAWSVRARILGFASRYDDMLLALDKAIKLSPSNPVLWELRVTTLIALSRLEEVIASAERAIALGAVSMVAWAGKAVALFQLGNVSTARQVIDEALQAAPEDALLWGVKAFMATQLDDEDTLVFVEKATALSPQDSTLTGLKGVALLKRGRHEDALQVFRSIVSTDASSAQGWIGISRALMDLGQTDGAIEAFERALALGAGGPREWLAYLQIVLNQGDWSKAMGALALALDRNLFGEQGDPGLTEALLRFVANSSSSEVMRERAAELVSSYADRQLLPPLAGMVLLVGLSGTSSHEMANVALERWLGVWEQVGSSHPEFLLPLKLTKYGLEYSRSGDPRVLLELPAEERRLVDLALGLEGIQPGTYELDDQMGKTTWKLEVKYDEA